MFRSYQTEDDSWRMRGFLRQVLLLNDRRARSWHVARLDYARWHTCLNCAHVRLEDVAYLWETDGQIIAMLMPDGGRGEAHLSVHPERRTSALEEEMLTVAEARLFAGSHRPLWLYHGRRPRALWPVAQGVVTLPRKF